MIETDGMAEAHCHFCNEKYLYSREELEAFSKRSKIDLAVGEREVRGKDLLLIIAGLILLNCLTIIYFLSKSAWCKWYGYH